ncbi:hypothetical protein TBS_11340 [Thermobispora bispora]|jgi:hypothetical protein|uniref:Molybdopterin oxidoreductase n=1 Tax=Thermobispora bispora (strain ATCC 19993 / DSM 43833 / CBS 139.67 / JCM 10125 / KCTC 9307 / NBRC 14880 / R51) TaxID=469371 RepID=D6Y2I3_THEBD|nr:molybdopterin oxidoreductase [Thermobispora bispora]MBO2473416.1 hypothetical protein [Actinomycetales bacterium]MDI9581096.1 hypothetical protein [Thermobispora sp.]ADG88832.1 molybdopterin oxidoreductase [Thermobispora bispora DSM 43833]MBX6166434.1 hypothetical protein [Thermobispora bispora]QSI48595.1 hypothetical protein CYL17_12605 [Thermobispora bispora]
MHLARYLGRLQRSQRELADAYHAFRRRHPREVDLCTVCERLAAQCGDHAVRLEPFIRRYASGAPPDPLDRPAPDPTERSGTLGLLRDLHDLYLLAADCDLSWRIVGQAAQGVRDAELLDLVRYCGEESARHLLWLRSRISEAAPQALVVA